MDVLCCNRACTSCRTRGSGWSWSSRNSASCLDSAGTYTCHDSGEKKVNGEKTFRGNKHLGPMIIEACWIAIYKDMGLAACYAYHKQRMNPQKAIVRVARRMSNIIYSVLKNDKAYEPYQWDK